MNTAYSAVTSSSAPRGVGLVGCGKISGAYLDGLRAYPNVRVVGCADLDEGLAQRTARERGLDFGGSVEALLTRPEVAIVVNLTIPAAHAELNRRALAAGKHVYCEKPFALSAADTAAVLAEATKAGRRVGSAPDTFLGSGHQTARRLIDAGAIGRPVAALGYMLCPGHESWHPNPGFYYQPGGGPMWDMGPYYVTALVNLLGPVAKVCGLATRTRDTRVITSEPRRGEVIPVQVATHYTTTLEFASGVPATLVMSFDTHAMPSPHIVVLGTEGNLEVPDPNHFDGPVVLRRPGAEPELIASHHAPGRKRGSGVADLAAALGSGRAHRADGRLAHHVIEVLEAADRAASEERHISIVSRTERPSAVPVELAAGEFEA
jgi:predicted dehydrogenase